MAMQKETEIWEWDYTNENRGFHRLKNISVHYHMSQQPLLLPFRMATTFRKPLFPWRSRGASPFCSILLTLFLQTRVFCLSMFLMPVETILILCVSSTDASVISILLSTDSEWYQASSVLKSVLHGWEQVWGLRNMVQWVKVLVAESDDLSCSQKIAWQKEKISSHSLSFDFHMQTIACYTHRHP